MTLSCILIQKYLKCTVTKYKIKLTYSYKLSLSNVEPNFYFPPNVEHCFLFSWNSQWVSKKYIHLDSEMAAGLTCYDIDSFNNFTDVGVGFSLMIYLTGQSKLLLKSNLNTNNYRRCIILRWMCVFLSKIICSFINNWNCFQYTRNINNQIGGPTSDNIRANILLEYQHLLKNNGYCKRKAFQDCLNFYGKSIPNKEKCPVRLGDCDEKSK